MKPILTLLFLLGWTLTAFAGSPPEKPPLPFLDWNACPFECCTYRDWYASAALTAYSRRSVSSPAAFSIAKGEKVHGITGVVVTTRFGVAKLLEPTKVGFTKNGKGPELPLDAGAILYTLHYEGEGSYLFWYKGATYSDGIGDSDSGGPFKVESQPEYVWWAKVRNSAGLTGWVKMDDSFTNVDACG